MQIFEGEVARDPFTIWEGVWDESKQLRDLINSIKTPKFATESDTRLEGV